LATLTWSQISELLVAQIGLVKEGADSLSPSHFQQVTELTQAHQFTLQVIGGLVQPDQEVKPHEADWFRPLAFSTRIKLSPKDLGLHVLFVHDPLGLLMPNTGQPVSVLSREFMQLKQLAEIWEKALTICWAYRVGLKSSEHFEGWQQTFSQYLAEMFKSPPHQLPKDWATHYQRLTTSLKLAREAFAG
jgi:hypothetical protein